MALNLMLLADGYVTSVRRIHASVPFVLRILPAKDFANLQFDVREKAGKSLTRRRWWISVRAVMNALQLTGLGLLLLRRLPVGCVLA
jgi:hypothetical protein